MQLPTTDLYPNTQNPVGDVTVTPMIGAGLTGRPTVRPPLEPELDPDREPEPDGMALPSLCVRRLQLPEQIAVRSGGGCPDECPGRQPDGGCLADLIRALPADAEWTCTVQPVDEYGNVAWQLVV